MRGLSLTILFTLYQCTHGEYEYQYPQWDKYERAAYLWPSMFIGSLVVVCIVWACIRKAQGLPIIQDVDEQDHASELRRELRRYRRYGDHR